MRGKKTILISTHDMEEADILADRIAIIDNGVLKSYATSMYLKKKFGNIQIFSIVLYCLKIVENLQIETFMSLNVFQSLLNFEKHFTNNTIK